MGMCRCCGPKHNNPMEDDVSGGGFFLSEPSSRDHVDGSPTSRALPPPWQALLSPPQPRPPRLWGVPAGTYSWWALIRVPLCLLLLNLDVSSWESGHLTVLHFCSGGWWGRGVCNSTQEHWRGVVRRDGGSLGLCLGRQPGGRTGPLHSEPAVTASLKAHGAPPAGAGRLSEAQTQFSKTLGALTCPVASLRPMGGPAWEAQAGVLGAPGEPDAPDGGGACALREACEQFSRASECRQDTFRGAGR